MTASLDGRISHSNLLQYKQQPQIISDPACPHRSILDVSSSIGNCPENCLAICDRCLIATPYMDKAGIMDV